MTRRGKILNARPTPSTHRPRARSWPGLCLVVAWLHILFAAGALAQEPIPSRFAYRGVLTDGGEAVETGGEPVAFDLELRVFDHPDASQATQVGPMISLEGHSVVDGLIEAELDFGAEIFQLPRRYLEIRYRPSDGSGEPRVMRSLLQISASAPEEELLPPPESDADLLRRLEIARIVISDRQEPGKPHFLVDEQSFRRAYGVASPVTATDVASVAMVAASELRRQTVRSRERIEALEAEISVLRFRSNLTFLMLAAMIVSVLLSRTKRPTPGREPEPLADGEAETGAGAETPAETSAEADGAADSGTGPST